MRTAAPPWRSYGKISAAAAEKIRDASVNATRSIERLSSLWRCPSREGSDESRGGNSLTNHRTTTTSSSSRAALPTAPPRTDEEGAPFETRLGYHRYARRVGRQKGRPRRGASHSIAQAFLFFVRFFFSFLQSPTAGSNDRGERARERANTPEQSHRAGPPNVNDPSAGSPTETLLRLLLPLNDQVWSSSRQHRQCRGTAAHQSEDLTKSFNR